MCNHIERRVIHVGLALGKSPHLLSRKFKNLSRRQIKVHRDKCLKGDALTAVALQRDWITPDAVEPAPGEGEKPESIADAQM